VSIDGLHVDTLMFFGDVEQETVRVPWGATPIVPPAARQTTIAVQPTVSRVCVGDQQGPEIRCFGPGDARTVIRWMSEPTAITGNEVNAWREATIALYAQKLTETDVTSMLDQVTVPETRPHYGQIVLDRVGNVWVRLGPSTGTASETADYLVFDPTGTLLGTVVVPAARVLEIGDDYVMGIYRDELEVEYLHVYELMKTQALTGVP
jgi:hypothetical protein